jgi:predicted Zn-dependent protease
MEDVKHAKMEAQGRYVSGPVELLVQREEEKLTLHLYPQHLPAEYGLLINPSDYQVNAYAGQGRIILTQRLVNLCLNDHEIALVVGHELAHQTQGHLVRGALHRELGKFVGEAVLAFSTFSLPRLLDWRYVAVDPEVRRVAQDAVVSVFSRDDEREADAYGLWYAFQAGYDVDAATAFWERVAGVVEKDPFSTTYYLSSHPASLERLARLKRISRYFQAGRAAEVFLQTADLDRQPPP